MKLDFFILYVKPLSFSGSNYAFIIDDDQIILDSNFNNYNPDIPSLPGEKYEYIQKWMKEGIVRKVENVEFDPQGSCFQYFSLNRINEEGKTDIKDVSEVILLFQEDQNGEMKQLTASPDWNRNYVLSSYNGKFNPTFPLSSLISNSPNLIKNPINLRKDFTLENENRIDSARSYYKNYEETKILGEDFVRQILGIEILYPMVADNQVNILFMSRLPWKDLIHLIDINTKAKRIINSREFVIGWLNANNYPPDIIRDTDTAKDFLNGKTNYNTFFTTFIDPRYKDLFYVQFMEFLRKQSNSQTEKLISLTYKYNSTSINIDFNQFRALFDRGFYYFAKYIIDSFPWTEKGMNSTLYFEIDLFYIYYPQYEEHPQLSEDVKLYFIQKIVENMMLNGSINLSSWFGIINNKYPKIFYYLASKFPEEYSRDKEAILNHLNSSETNLDSSTLEIKNYILNH